MNTRKIKVNLADRPFTLLCSFFTFVLGNRSVDRTTNSILSVMIRYTDKIYDMVRKKYHISNDWFITVLPSFIIADRFEG